MSEIIKNAVSESRTFETALRERDERFKKLGWFLSGVFGFLLTGAIAAILIILPLKTTTVELYALNQQAGRIDKVTTVEKSALSESDALNNFEAASYVKRRERYNYFALQRDYDDTQLFNSPDVNNEYLARFKGAQAPDVVFNKAAYLVSIDVISNVHSEGTQPDRIGMLRIKRTIRRIADGAESHDFWSIRLTYRYVPQKEFTLSQREVNPFGFMITSYQRFKEKNDE
ncbi:MULTISPECIES: virB8 family protein [Enterobacterales]|uniref:virB8 family protein n=1 Tax=Enterobacterales TaxID=91347 RepID=UPI000EF8244E|nr:MULTISPECIES: type IV secretion system protein [Enterobacterales]AYN25688.1 type IV secretion system protein [Buttiauxella sp. 3AFRM03]UNK63133.1 type IV secretion system protein [Buttiauxella ferragutiae]CAI0846806.1 Pertussis toxin liberation protein E [Serratia quinivorans]CAI1600811.1 Pertussis toxin liberation protein E [Serratia quinivorans]